MSRNHARLNSRRWERVRRACLDRDGWRCQHCGRYGNEADHIVPLEQGGAPYDLENTQTLCKTCHIAKTQSEKAGIPNSARDAWNALVRELSS